MARNRSKPRRNMKGRGAAMSQSEQQLPASLPMVAEPLEGRTHLAVAIGLMNNVLTIVGDAQNNQVIVTEVNGMLLVSVGGQLADQYPTNQVNQINMTGDAGNDELLVGSAITIPAVITGNDGEDTLSGGDGNDTISGGANDDTITADGGNDTVHGDGGEDLLAGGDNNDLLTGGDNADTLIGGIGNDTLLGGADGDELIGNAGDDSLSGEAGTDSLRGDEDRDVLLGGSDADTLDGGTGSDTMNGNGGDDYFDAMDDLYNDYADGDEGNDSFQAYDSGDVLTQD